MIWPTDGDEDDDENEAWEPKNRRPREVPISDALLPWLTGERRSAWVFPASTGKRYAYWPENQFQRVQRKAGLKGGVHTLRHTYASYFLQTKSLGALAGVLGHSHTRVTELYAHLLPSHLESARNAVSFAPSAGPAIVVAKRRWSEADVVDGDTDGDNQQPRVRKNVR